MGDLWGAGSLLGAVCSHGCRCPAWKCARLSPLAAQLSHKTDVFYVLYSFRAWTGICPLSCSLWDSCHHTSGITFKQTFSKQYFSNIFALKDKDRPYTVYTVYIVCVLQDICLEKVGVYPKVKGTFRSGGMISFYLCFDICVDPLPCLWSVRDLLQLVIPIIPLWVPLVVSAALQPSDVWLFVAN